MPTLQDLMEARLPERRSPLSILMADQSVPIFTGTPQERTLEQTAPGGLGGVIGMLIDPFRKFTQAHMAEYQPGASVQDMPQTMQALPEAAMATLGAPAAVGGVPGMGMGIRAYHGSPHDFERFDLSKIGTGEGAQAYGHGLYFAENPAVAADYRRRLADMSAPLGAFRTGAGEEISVLDWPKGLSSLLQRRQSIGPDVPYKELLSRAEAEVARLRDPQFRGPLIARNREEAQSLVDWLRSNEGVGWQSNPERGRMYEVNINAHPDQFLNWDKPLFKQGDVGQVVGKIADEMIGPNNIYNSSMGPSGFPHLVKNPDFTQKAAAEGIPGIKYLDQGSRAAGEGSRNYVVFNDKLIDILRKYGIAATGGPLGALMMQPEPSQ